MDPSLTRLSVALNLLAVSGSFSRIVKVEAAYRRGDLFEKRRKLMAAWAGFCAAPGGGKVVVTARVSS